jgi:uncharacterized protein DUF6600
VTACRIVHMLCGVAMILRPRSAAVLAAIASLLPALTRCEPWEEAPPPATPAAAAAVNASAAPPADPGPPPATDPHAVAPDANASYASGEYAIGADSDSYDDNDPSALTDFRSALDSHGAWVDDPTYGTVWVPAPAEVGADFSPYVTGGHWAYDDDYVWVSDYSWGWAPFHYGRWVFAEGRGWVWIPGREYRGAWVTWSVDDGYGYLGWAPMGPAFLWFGGVPVGWHGYWGPRWAYVPRGEVFAPRVGARVVVGPAAVTVAARMRPYAAVGNARFSAGPPPARFGYAPAQVPRVTGGAAVSVTHAQQFARPSTARAIGASAPTRFEARPLGASPSTRFEERPAQSVPQTRSPAIVGPRSPTYDRGPASIPPHVSAPGPVPSNLSRAPATTDAARVPARPVAPAPAPHSGGSTGGHAGGGHHR